MAGQLEFCSTLLSLQDQIDGTITICSFAGYSDRGEVWGMNCALALKASIPIPLARASYRTTSNLGVGEDRNASYIAPGMGWGSGITWLTALVITTA